MSKPAAAKSAAVAKPEPTAQVVVTFYGEDFKITSESLHTVSAAQFQRAMPGLWREHQQQKRNVTVVHREKMYIQLAQDQLAQEAEKKETI